MVVGSSGEIGFGVEMLFLGQGLNSEVIRQKQDALLEEAHRGLSLCRGWEARRIGMSIWCGA